MRAQFSMGGVWGTWLWGCI